MRYRPPRYLIVIVLVAYLTGCGVLGHSLGDIAAPIFCTAARPGWASLASVQGFLLLATIPMLVAGIFLERLRWFVLILGVVAILGLVAQSKLIESQFFYCDAP